MPGDADRRQARAIWWGGIKGTRERDQHHGPTRPRHPHRAAKLGNVTVAKTKISVMPKTSRS